jgi:hypothetical protein
MEWKHLGDTTPTAIRPYRCLACDGSIATGEKHVKRSGVREGKIECFRMHSACEDKTRLWAHHDPADFRREELGMSGPEIDEGPDGGPETDGEADGGPEDEVKSKSEVTQPNGLPTETMTAIPTPSDKEDSYAEYDHESQYE